MLGLTIRQWDGQAASYRMVDEREMTFIGFLLFFDPPKPDVQQAIVDLAQRGVWLKTITGDNKKVARHVAQAVHLPVLGLLTGNTLNDMPDQALWHAAEHTNIFAEVDPHQKERIILPCARPDMWLVNNCLSDIPAIPIAGDNVDPDWLAKPRQQNTVFIRDYVVLFGPVSSIFDFLTFGLLLFIFRASPAEFRTGWFIESLLTELVIALVVRTPGPFFRSRLGKLLLVSTLIVVGLTLVLAQAPFNFLFGFIPLLTPLMLTMLGLMALYVLATEIAKKDFYSRLSGR